MMFGVKRVLAVLVVLTVGAVALSACGSGNNDSTQSSSSEKSGGGETSNLASFKKLAEEHEAAVTEWPAGAPTEPVKDIEVGKLIVDITLSPEEPASLAAAEGVVEASKVLGWETKLLFTEYSAQKAAAAFEQAVALGADAVVTQGIEPSQFKSQIKKLHDSGAILVSNFTDEGVSPDGSDAEVSQQSQPAGEYIASKTVVDSGGKGQFAVFTFPEYHTTTNETTAARERLEECAECEVLPEIKIASAEAEKTMPAATSTLLQKNPELTGIISGIDTFVPTLQLPTIRQQGSDVALYTFLGGKATLEGIEKGEIEAVVVLPLTWGGWAAADNVARVFAGQETNDGDLPLRILDKENVQEALSTAGSNGFWDADGFNYRGEYEKLWGVK